MSLPKVTAMGAACSPDVTMRQNGSVYFISDQDLESPCGDGSIGDELWDGVDGTHPCTVARALTGHGWVTRTTSGIQVVAPPMGSTQRCDGAHSAQQRTPRL